MLITYFNSKLRYRFLKAYRYALGYFYRALKKAVRSVSGYNTRLASDEEGLRVKTMMPPFPQVVDRADLKNHKKKWRKLSSGVSGVYMDIYPAYAQVKSIDYVPDSLYFTHIEPMLNNRDFSRSFADKNMYSLLVERELQPAVFLRKIHGRYLDGDYQKVTAVDEWLASLAQSHERFILKTSLDSQGGKSISLLTSRKGAFYAQGSRVSRDWLDRHYNDHFLVQEVIRQHPFYAAFNSASLNTLRVFTYRSLSDETVHVLHAALRVGGEGSVVDNVSMGGRALGIAPDGTLNGICIDHFGHTFSKVGEVVVQPGTPLFKYDEVSRTAKRLASQQLYTRVIGFDFCVDHNEQVRLIELNNFDIGVDMLQKCSGPLFGKFTDEVLDFCVKQKKGFRYQIR